MIFGYPRQANATTKIAGTTKIAKADRALKMREYLTKFAAAEKLNKMFYEKFL